MKYQTVGVFTYGIAFPIEGKFRVNDSLGRLVDDLAKIYPSVLAVFAKANLSGIECEQSVDSPLYRHEICSTNVELETIPLVENRRPTTLLVAALTRVFSIWGMVRKCDFVYVFVPGAMGLSVVVCCRILRKPYGLYFGADWIENAGFRAQWGRGGRFWRLGYLIFAKYAEKFIASKAKFILVTGLAYIERLRTYNQTVFETVLMSSVGLDDFSRVQRKGLSNSKKIVLLFVGPVTERKGVEYLIRAIPLLAGFGVEVDRLELNLVGALHEGYWRRLQTVARDLNLSSLIKSFGYVSDKSLLLEHYRKSSLLVLPSLAEGFPRVIYEAMSQGLPVVSTSIASIKETLGEGNAILMAKPEDPKDLARQLARIILNDQLYLEMSKGGYALAEKRMGGDPATQVSSLINAPLG